MEERLVRIETKLSFSEDLLDELNRTVYRQQQQIDRMQQQIRHLHERLEALGANRPRDPREEIPPHY